MTDELISSLRQQATVKVEGATPRLSRLLFEAANRIELQLDIIRDRERDADRWRRRALEAENRLRLRGIT